MNQVTQLAELVENKQISDVQRTSEEFQILKVRQDNNQFNMTVKNSGEIPIHLTRLWIENTTDSSFPIAKFDLDISIPPGSEVYNIGQNLGLNALPTQSYYAQLVTERGNVQPMYFNSVEQSPLFMRLTASPTIIPTTFSSTISLEVINIGTTQLLDIQPLMYPPTAPSCNGCTWNEEQTVQPTSFESLQPGDTAIFEWVYSFTGENSDQLDFVAGLTNDPLRNATVSLTLQTIESALNADVAVESGGLGNQVLIDDDILLFHLESYATPGGEYQMWSGIGDGGTNGLRISLDTTTPHMMTNNGSTAITIPEGDWNLAMMLSAEPVPTSLKGDGEDLIYHFEDGDNEDPDNSEGDSSRDLEECGVASYSQIASVNNNDAEQRTGNPGSMTLGSSDLDLGSNGGTEQIVGIRFTGVNIAQGTTVNSAEIIFQADESDSSGVILRIYGEDVDDAGIFTNSNWDITDRPQTGNFTDWIVPAWSTNEIGPDTTTPNLSNIIQEIVDRPGWVSGNDIVIMLDNNGPIGINRGAASVEDGLQAPNLAMTWGNGAVPDWQPNSGPHDSGSYYFDGLADCFRSSNNVSGGDDNDIRSGSSTTALWFKTNGVVNSEQYLLDWSATGCPSCDYYRLGLTSIGKVFFEYSTDDGGDVVRCESNQEYDDSLWYHAVATRDGGDDECRLELKDTTGTDVESQIFTNMNNPTSSVDVSGKWHVGSNVAEDGKFFKGWIDDIMHWDDYEMSNAEMDDIARVNYGTGAYEFDVNLDLTDANGNFISTIYSGSAVNVNFADPKDGGDNDDWAYSQNNMTWNLPATIIGEDERMELYFSYVASPVGNKVPLEVDMKIDDTSMNNPYPSFLQIPYPPTAFPSYYVHDNDDEFDVIITNTGEDGIFLTYQGTRVSFNGTSGSYAGMIDSVNGTGNPYTLSEDRDSLYIPAGSNARAYFHEATNIPSTDENTGDKPPPGAYRTTIWINGYSDQGETFTRAVVIGSVTVTE